MSPESQFLNPDKSITFVSTFPNEANMRDGYFRRVHYVDQAFDDYQKIHLDIRFAMNFVKRKIQRDDNTIVVHLNAFVHFFLIWRVLLKSGIVYIHSIAKAPSILFQLLFLRKKILFVLDLHGVMVDEHLLEGKKGKARFYSIIEKLCFKNTRLNVYVSKVMQRHFEKKYPAYKGKAVIFATNSPNTESSDGRAQNLEKTGLSSDNCALSSKSLKMKLGYEDDDIIIIYSGNLQPWQNIDLMLGIMEGLEDERVKFLILSGQKKQFEEKLKKKNIPSGRIAVLSVSPDDLAGYYELAHYGFVLRDDILVNRVANPTKLAEYLQYGITPIVKLEEIGDYKEMGYKYVKTQFIASLRPGKSETNRNVYKSISQKYGSETLRQAISETIGDTDESL